MNVKGYLFFHIYDHLSIHSLADMFVFTMPMHFKVKFKNINFLQLCFLFHNYDCLNTLCFADIFAGSVVNGTIASVM